MSRQRTSYKIWVHNSAQADFDFAVKHKLDDVLRAMVQKGLIKRLPNPTQP